MRLMRSRQRLSGGRLFLVPAHNRRRIVHVNVTAHPTAEWTIQQPREAFPWSRNTSFGIAMANTF
jgi:hypothetical protein